MRNQIVWCDIPVKDLDRALKFYSAVLGVKIERQTVDGMSFGLLPCADNNVSGCIVESGEGQPSANGPMIYLNCEGRHDAASSVVKANGGIIMKAKHQIGSHGFRTIILDSEGNRLALHSMT